MNLQKCAVIGTGFVGATAAYTLATSGLFSELVLLDVNRAKAEGEAADISHGVSFAQPCSVLLVIIKTSRIVVSSYSPQVQTRSPMKLALTCCTATRQSCKVF